MYGARCVSDALGARCAFAFCPDAGERDICFNDTHLGHCSNGRLTSQGDCGAYAAFCSTVGGPARCVSSFCVDDRDAAPVAHDACWITGGQRLHCDANGAPTTSPCPAGQSCSMVGGAHCEASRCPATGESDVCAGPRVIGHCFNGSVIRPRSCGAEAFCSTLSGTAPHCVSARCVASGDEVPVERSVCLPDGRIAHCDGDGALGDARACDEGTRCVTTGNEGRCRLVTADAGSTTDAGSADDAGPSADAGPMEDAGSAADAGADETGGPTPVAGIQGGCGVARGGSSAGAGAWLLALAAVALRRRRVARVSSSGRC